MSNGLHHLHTRHRLYGKLEKYPHPHAGVRLLDFLMYAIALLNPLVLVPQIVQVYADKSVAGLSLATWAMLAFINAAWTFYSAVHRDMPVFIASLLMGVLDIVIVIGIFMYR